MDAVGVLVLWISHMFWHLESPSSAARRISRARFRDIENEDEEESLTSLEKNTPFRMVVFVFGVLPQAIKLFASSGIPWLKAWAAMYLGSWTVLEVLIGVLAAGDKHRSTEGVNSDHTLTSAAQLKWKRLRKAWAACAIVNHTVLLAVGTSWLLFQHLMGLLYFALQIASSLALWLIILDDDGASDEQSQLYLYSTVSFLFFSGFTILNHDGPEYKSQLWTGFGVWIITSVFFLTIAVMPQSTFKRLHSKLLATTSMSLSFFVSLALNVYSLYVYFAWKYTAKGTSIPEWTRWLG